MDLLSRFKEELTMQTLEKEELFVGRADCRWSRRSTNRPTLLRGNYKENSFVSPPSKHFLFLNHHIDATSGSFFYEGAEMLQNPREPGRKPTRRLHMVGTTRNTMTHAD